MFPIADERPSCAEERAALKRAQARLAYCEQKSERVRHWQQTLRHELFEYEGRISQLVKVVEIDVPQSIAVLNKILRYLEEYHAVRAADPRSSYDDVAVVKAIWTDEETQSNDDPSAGGTAASAAASTGQNVDSGGSAPPQSPSIAETQLHA
jgi:hypothetical protein